MYSHTTGQEEEETIAISGKVVLLLQLKECRPDTVDRAERLPSVDKSQRRVVLFTFREKSGRRGGRDD